MSTNPCPQTLQQEVRCSGEMWTISLNLMQYRSLMESTAPKAYGNNNSTNLLTAYKTSSFTGWILSEQNVLLTFNQNLWLSACLVCMKFTTVVYHCTGHGHYILTIMADKLEVLQSRDFGIVEMVPSGTHWALNSCLLSFFFFICWLTHWAHCKSGAGSPLVTHCVLGSVLECFSPSFSYSTCPTATLMTLWWLFD